MDNWIKLTKKKVLVVYVSITHKFKKGAIRITNLMGMDGLSMMDKLPNATLDSLRITKNMDLGQKSL